MTSLICQLYFTHVCFEVLVYFETLVFVVKRLKSGRKKSFESFIFGCFSIYFDKPASKFA